VGQNLPAPLPDLYPILSLLSMANHACCALLKSYFVFCPIPTTSRRIHTFHRSRSLFRHTRHQQYPFLSQVLEHTSIHRLDRLQTDTPIHLCGGELLLHYYVRVSRQAPDLGLWSAAGAGEAGRPIVTPADLNFPPKVSLLWRDPRQPEGGRVFMTLTPPPPDTQPTPTHRTNAP